MSAQADKLPDNKSKSVVQEKPRKTGLEQSVIGFEDRRSEAIAQRKVQEMADNSQRPQSMQLKSLSEKNLSSIQHPIQKKVNKTGLPDNLKSGIENLSGYSMDDVRVHYNSDKPAQLQAHAYAQGTDIHIASGQEKYLPHEAWHVVQQKQGRVKPTMQMKGDVNVNDDAGLEKEADVMGEKAIQNNSKTYQENILTGRNSDNLVQRKIIARIRTAKSDSPDFPRVISELRLEGRAPTDAEGQGQGDHTVAETLINESVRQEVMGMPRRIALNNIMVLASLTLPEEGAKEIATNYYNKYWEEFDHIEGEDQNIILEECIQRYIEIANKRPGTAFARNKEVTRGGGSERQAIGLIRELADKLNAGKNIEDDDLMISAQSILDLIDIKYTMEEEDRYINIVVRALQHAVLSVLLLTKSQIEALTEYLITGLGQRDEFAVNRSIHIYNEVLKRLY